ncbi:DUF1853 family protein [uncultured Kordia sp.]|uniref:DUF1853 family protein n=1 Tax=uncultured Kordia sp. TaxID=507699 RepID=UPI0026365521|nr:DUF1853 family protein [uncultured Kordia sp.]
MNTNSRITSVLKAAHLDNAITGLPTFFLSDLNLETDLQFELPTNLRLGHMVEKIVSECIKSSSNYKVLFENIQIQKDKDTIGELDFIIEELKSKQVIHLELAYKFYLYDPTLSENSFHNWIGPNRRDSLQEKLDKLKHKQFPLLYNQHTKENLSTLDIDNVSQVLCLLASLYIPYTYKETYSPNFQKAIKGYYVNFETFINFDHTDKMYHLPTKKEWGIDPVENKIWTHFEETQIEIERQLQKKHAPLCWLKHIDSYECFFVVWW